MADDAIETDADRPARPEDPEARARALQSLLIEKEALSTDAVDEVISLYETEVGPMHGAEVVARAWSDPDYEEWLLADGTAAITLCTVGVFSRTTMSVPWTPV